MNFYKAILYTIIYILLIEFIGFWIFLVPEEYELEIIHSYRFINAIGMLIALLIFFIFSNNKHLLKFDKTESKFYFFAIFIGIVFAFSQPILKLIVFWNVPENFMNFKLKTEFIFQNLIASIILYPITEELFFRNFIQRKLNIKFNHWKSILISSILFALIHIPFYYIIFHSPEFNVGRIYIAFLGGLISGYIFYKSKSIGPSIIFHMFWNITANLIE